MIGGSNTWDDAPAPPPTPPGRKPRVFLRSTGELVDIDDDADPGEILGRRDRGYEYVVTCPCGCDVSFGVN